MLDIITYHCLQTNLIYLYVTETHSDAWKPTLWIFFLCYFCINFISRIILTIINQQQKNQCFFDSTSKQFSKNPFLRCNYKLLYPIQHFFSTIASILQWIYSKILGLLYFIYARLINSWWIYFTYKFKNCVHG